MDPVFMRYSQSNGVPQESKLASYMSRQGNETPTSNSLRQSFASKLSLDTPSPSTTPKKSLINTPEFIPKSSSASVSPILFNTFTPTSELSFSNASEEHDHGSTHITPESSSPPHPHNSSLEVAEKMPNIVAAYQENVGGTTYYYQAPIEGIPNNDMVNHTLTSEYSAFPGIPAHIATIKSKQDPSFFMSDDVRMDVLTRSMLTLLQPDPEQFPDIPLEIDSYHQLCPLEPLTNNSVHKAHLGYQASMYKATHIKTGLHYCIRRIHGFRLQNTKCMMFVDLWKKLSHSNIVQLKEVFTTKAFEDNSLLFVYDYHPGSETLLHKHFSPDQHGGYSDPFATDTSTPRPYSHQKNNILRHQQTNKLPEPLIWNYIMQLTSALRLIHASGLACRSLDPTKIILTSRNRLRLSCLGVMDLIGNESNSTVNAMTLVHHYQQEDLTALGKLVLALACKSTMAVQRENISTALDIVSRTYTPDLRNLIMYLLSQQQRRSVIDLMPMIGARFYTQLDNLQNHIEVLECELSKEVENGRLFRLMTKLATINERPEFNMDAAWSETGDRYMLKLFRDYVFHQVSEGGNPWLDMAHIVQSLNKLDAGVPEKVCLMSRDEQSILVVSYGELKHCLEKSFGEVFNASLLNEELTREEKL